MGIVNQNLKFLRKEYLNISQREISEAFNTSRTTYDSWERTIDPGSKRLAKLRELYDIDLNMFLTVEMNKNNASQFFDSNKSNINEMTIKMLEDGEHVFDLIDTLGTDDEKIVTIKKLKKIYYDQQVRISVLFSSSQELIKEYKSTFK